MASAFVSLDKYRADLAQLNDDVRFYRTYLERAHNVLKEAYYYLCNKHYADAEKRLENAMALCSSRPPSSRLSVVDKRVASFSSVADGEPMHFEFEGER